METTFRQRFKQVFFYLILGFVGLFIFRIAYGYTVSPSQNSNYTRVFDGINSLTRNYASKEYKVKGGEGARQSPVSVDQKYEKVAEVNTKSAKFDKEEKTARQAIKAQNALIQYEQKSGNKGRRQLHLLIGVPPENFDSLYQRLILIGTVQNKQITKKDKTNEYRELNAKKASLDKIRNSLIDLKSKGGKIEEYMQLENRILDIEQQLQELGVSLGDFDAENEFCTVKFSLQEGKEVQISLMHRIKVALKWTVEMYLQIMVMLFFLTLFAYVGVLLLDKLKVLERMYR